MSVMKFDIILGNKYRKKDCDNLILDQIRQPSEAQAEILCTLEDCKTYLEDTGKRLRDSTFCCEVALV